MGLWKAGNNALIVRGARPRSSARRSRERRWRAGLSGRFFSGPNEVFGAVDGRFAGGRCLRLRGHVDVASHESTNDVQDAGPVGKGFAASSSSLMWIESPVVQHMLEGV